MRRIYLVQHGLAQSKEENPDRPLSEEGRSQTERVANHLAAKDVFVDQFYHSGKTRAFETAKIFKEHLNVRAEITQADGLAPMDNPSVAAGLLAHARSNVMFVGHLPHMSKFVAYLVNGSEDSQPVKVANSAVTCLVSDGDTWKVDWIIHPKMI